MSKQLTITLFILSFCATLFSQKVKLDGYVFEKNNRGFLNEVKVTILDPTGVILGEVLTDIDGHYNFEVPLGKDYNLDFSKKIFKSITQLVSTKGKNAGESIFVKTELERQPGYLLEVTLAEKRFSEDVNVDAVHGSRIEIYNHTTKKEELVVDSAQSPVFSITLQQGNEYTIMVRKKGFYNKRLHANVNINGCYLCMDGFGTVNPGVVSNLTAAEDNKLGTLLANVEFERIDTTRNIVIQNIYYASNSSELFENARKELDKVAQLLKSNPSLVVELGSHTDSRGSDDANKTLSQSRAQSAVDYLLSSPWIESARLKAKGYGESRLVNKCGNGMACNDQEHAQNRRTELRIIGFTNDSYESKSLLEIIHQEDMMNFVTSGESEKVYTSANANPASSSSTPTTNNNFESTNEPQITSKNPEIKQPNTTANTVVEKIEEDTPSINEASKTENTEDVAVMPKRAIPKEATIPGMVNMAVNLQNIGEYSGYKVELFTASEPMSPDDPDLKMIANEVASDIYVDKLANGSYSYSVGNFQNWGETENFLSKVVKKYPKSKIIDFFKGKRVGQ
jgi:outer membrane protein OmpA-like peptidoglycan-associated protein